MTGKHSVISSESCAVTEPFGGGIGAIDRVGARSLPALLLLVVAAALVGCGSGEVRGRIVGKVTFQGRPVTDGILVFSDDEKGVHMTTRLGPDGGYELRTAKGVGLPVGTYRISVCPPPLAPAKISFEPDAAATSGHVNEYVNIPARYRDQATSGLTVTVKEGENALDIAMQP
jgi:hypothetical protein